MYEVLCLYLWSIASQFHLSSQQFLSFNKFCLLPLIRNWSSKTIWLYLLSHNQLISVLASIMALLTNVCSVWDVTGSSFFIVSSLLLETTATNLDNNGNNTRTIHVSYSVRISDLVIIFENNKQSLLVPVNSPSFQTNNRNFCPSKIVERPVCSNNNESCC